jgi:hypothetical protein
MKVNGSRTRSFSIKVPVRCDAGGVALAHALIKHSNRKREREKRKLKINLLYFYLFISI